MTYQPECEECGVKTAKLSRDKTGEKLICDGCLGLADDNVKKEA